MMFRCAIGLCALLALTVCARAENEEDVKLTALFKTYLDDWFALKPLDATRLGDHRFDDKLDDLSPEARQRGTKLLEKTLADLPKKVNYDKLSRSGQIDYEIWQHDLKRSLWLAENTRPFEQDPRAYNEYISDSVYLLLAQSTLPKERNIANCVARMKLVPGAVAAAKKNLKDPPKAFVETAIRQNQGAINFYKRGIFELAGEKPESSKLAAPAKELIPVLEDYQKFLADDLLPRAKGEWRLGKEKFARKLVLELDAGLTADEVLKEAEGEFDRVVREMYVVARQLWSRAYPKKPLPPDDPAGRRETIRLVLEHFNKQHAKPEELVAQATADVEKIKKFITAKDILRLPEPDRCRIVEMPEFQRGNSTAYLNQAPPLDRDAASYYAISPPPRDWDARRVESFLEEYNQRMLQILSIHEGYPGHYVQLEYSNRHPSLIRRVLQSGVFAEGWAVYTEQMMLDQGYGDGDDVLRLNQLKWYLRAVTNAILDHKMHCQNMSDEEAYQLLTEGAYQSDGEAVGKIIRSKQSSCQLSTYFVGRTAFYRLRQSVQREQGDKFSIGRFHEAALDNGTLPVKYLPEVTRTRLKQPR
ncbi:MAG: DUF885 domain-containing protein [Gemmataceae bacterium]